MVFILPTDTCYWLAGEFTLQDYQEIYRLKWRDFIKPLAWVVRSYDDLQQYIEITDKQIDFLRKYPRPWSILGKRKSDFMLPDFLDEKIYQSISLRVAEICIPANIRNNLKYSLFLTSANLSWKPESKTLAEAREFFPDIDGLDGGTCSQDPSDIFSFWEDNEIIYLRRSPK